VNDKKKLEQTIQNVLTLTNLQEPDKVPTFLSVETGWALMYAGVKWADLEDDPEAFAEAYAKCWREIPIDSSFGHGPTRTTLRPPQALGNFKFGYSSDGLGITHNQSADVYLGPEVYDEILVDQAGLQDRFIRMNNPALNGTREEAVEAVRNAAKAQLVANETAGRISQILRDELGVFAWWNMDFSGLTPSYGYTSEFWTFYDRLRGPQNAFADLRRYPDKVKAACDFLFEQTKARMVYEEEAMKQPLPCGNSMFHPESYMSPKHFDELYFSRFMEILGPVMEAGKKVFLYGEGAFMRHIERFRETPKGSMVIVLDQDDPFEAKKKVGDWCTLVCGPKAELLHLGTEQQIKDYVKRCFDELAPGGGYVFALGNGLIAAKDVSVKGIVTAYETADELSRG
jgi:hypothetical protein